MRLFLLIVWLLSFYQCLSQIDSRRDTCGIDLPQCDIGAEAMFNWEQWTAFLQERLALDDASLDTIPGGSYTVLVHFAIDTNGKIEEVVLVKDPGHGLGIWVKKNLEACDRKIAHPFVEEKNRMRKSYHRQPITFVIEEEEVCEEDTLPLI